VKQQLFKLFSQVVQPLIGTKISRYRLPRKSYQYIYKLLSPDGIVLRQIHENQMYIDTRDKGIAPSLLLTGMYEPFATKVFMQLVGPGMTVFDVGANIGYYTLLAARIVGESGSVYSFEPDPENYKILVKNIGLNRFVNVVPIQKALSNASGTQQMYKDKDNWGMVSFSEKNVSLEANSYVTETTTLDNFIQQVSHVDIIKLDIEGAEGHVIAGGKKLLSLHSPVVLMEFIPTNLKNVGTSPPELLEKITQLGYLALMIDEREKATIPISFPDLLKQFDNPTRAKQSVNLVLYKARTIPDALILQKAS
jgi:FkbM family methyltransferase